MSGRKRNERPLPRRSDASAGASLALTNARRHLRVAKILGGEKLFGSAVAHVVLALEEIAKAWILTSSGIGIDVPKKSLRQVLTRHDARQAVTFGTLFVMLIQVIAIRTSSRVQRRHGVNRYPPELRDEWIDELRFELQDLWSRSPRREPILAVLEWTSTANDLKNQGGSVLL